jgi:hypothetical protein
MFSIAGAKVWEPWGEMEMPPGWEATEPWAVIGVFK